MPWITGIAVRQYLAYQIETGDETILHTCPACKWNALSFETLELAREALKACKRGESTLVSAGDDLVIKEVICDGQNHCVTIVE